MIKRKGLILIIAIIIIIASSIFIINFKKNHEEIPDNWEIKLSPHYTYSPPNALYIYEDYYIITKTSIEYGDNSSMIYYKSSIDKTVVEELKNLINQTESDSNQSPLGILPIEVNLNNGYACTVDLESNLIKRIENSLNYDGEIWYVD